MKRLLIVSLIALTACTKTIAVTPDPVAMPALPAPLNQRAEALPPITSNDLKTVLRDGVATDRAYADLRSRYNAVIDAWDCVRRSLNDGSKADECLADR